MRQQKPSAAAMRSVPSNGQIVFVHGGVAQYRDGVFYTGMDDPRWARPIQWAIEWWLPVDKNPRDEFAPVVEALRAIDRSMSDGLGDVPEWLTERMDVARSALASLESK